jgi:hypothetical protein
MGRGREEVASSEWRVDGGRRAERKLLSYSFSYSYSFSVLIGRKFEEYE